jgi:hypothetical protein
MGQGSKMAIEAIEIDMDARERRKALIIGSGSVSEGMGCGKGAQTSRCLQEELRFAQRTAEAAVPTLLSPAVPDQRSETKKAAPLLGPRFKEVKVVGECQERRWKLPSRKAERYFGKC